MSADGCFERGRGGINLYIPLDSVYTAVYIPGMIPYEKPNVASASKPTDDRDVKGAEPEGGKGSVKDSKRGIGKLSKCEGSSITLEGSGDRSGRDVNNSMSLGDFYGRFVVGREDGEG